MNRDVSRVLRLLRDSARHGRPCTSIALLAGLARMTPSEVRDAAEVLESKGLVVLSGDRVCYTGALDSHVLKGPAGSPWVSRLVERLKARRDIVYYAEAVAGSIPFADLLVARRDGVLFVARVVRREPPERLTMIARKLARIARRIAEGREDVPPAPRLRIVVPILVAISGAPRLIEGVLVKPLPMFERLVMDPWPEISHPLVRVYEYSPQAPRRST